MSARRCWNCAEVSEPCNDGGTPWCVKCGVVDDPSRPGQILLGHQQPDLQQQLDAANQRIAEMEEALTQLESELRHAQSESSTLRRHYMHEKSLKEAAERKLAAAREAMRVSHVLLDSRSRNADRIEKLLREALAQIEQQQQRLPGEDPRFDMCQCSDCVALRTRTELHA